MRPGWRRGLNVAQSLGHPLLQRSQPWLGKMAAALAGFAFPVALQRVIGPGQILLGGTLIGVLAGAILLASLHGRAEGWKLSIGVLTAFVLYSVIQ